jgi:hypothetical protein
LSSQIEVARGNMSAVASSWTEPIITYIKDTLITRDILIVTNIADNLDSHSPVVLGVTAHGKTTGSISLNNTL